MQCAKCSSDNLPGKKFCGDCGARLARSCPKCGAENPESKKFCGDCGTPLAAENRAAPAPETHKGGGAAHTLSVADATETANVPEGERKMVTALFADIKGSMELMEDLDPEEARAIVDPALKLMIDAAHRYDGYIVQSTGDGIFALFGAPVAHEDHPQRALYAALRMQEELRRYADQLRQEGKTPVQVRVGVNTGEVVVRSIQTEGGHAEYTPIGHSTGLAARLQTLANPGAVVVGESLRRLVKGYFQLKSLGRTRIKGVNEPVELFEVTGPGPLRTRLQVAAGRGLTKFVGRELELAQMRRALESARAGHGQIVAAMGEAGVGKSRLFFEFKATSQDGALALEAYSVSHGKASAYLPVIELLRGYFNHRPHDDPRQRREKVIGRVLELDRSLEDTLPYVFALLGIQDGDDPLAQMDGEIRRRRTQEALKRILLRESLNQPLILVFEDLHWIDDETQALLNLLADSIANARVLLLVNYRPEYRHEWGSRTHYTQLRLDPLAGDSADTMLGALLGDAVELAPVKRMVAERSQGNPFFIEEIVQALFDEGVLVRNGSVKVTGALAQVHLPPTVQGILAARIDRLPSREKDLLEALAVIGREFPLSLIKRVTQASGDERVERMLAGLQLGEFIYEQPAFPDLEYIFKHALTQEVAYNSVLLERRKLLHERTAAAMESLYAGRLEDHLDELAHHYGRSDNAPKAVEYLRLASAQALSRSHYTEANTHATAALNLLDKLPDGPDRLRAESALQMITAQASIAAIGYGAPEIEKALGRAAAICRQLGVSALEMFPVMGGLCGYYFARGEVRRGHELAAQLLEIGLKEGNKTLLLEAYLCLGRSFLYEGQFAQGLASLERAIAHQQPQQELNNVQGVDDPVALAFQTAASCLWHLGYADRALEMNARAFERTSALTHPHSIAIAWHRSCLERNLRRDSVAIEEAETTIALSTEHGFPYLYTWGVVTRGMALLEGGSAVDALAALAEGIGRLRMMKTTIGLPEALGCLAAVYGKMGNPREGLTVIADVLAEVEATSEREWEAELHRLRGELLLMKDASYAARAEESFRTAIDVARRQHARSWELRATMSLARLLDKQNKRDQAHAMLAEIYGWFTEGFDTADLRDAKALLEALAA